MINQQADQQTKQVNIAIIFHSNYGHTRRVATAIAQGASRLARVRLLDVAVLSDKDWHDMDNADVLVFGSAVYLGGVTAEFKAFMDSTSKRWLNRTWQGKLSAGFANSGGLSGDKLAVLQSLCLFAMQHGMNWLGLPLLPTGSADGDLNRLSSFLGLMTQSLDAPPEVTPCQGDIDTAVWFGEHLAKTAIAYTQSEHC